MIFDGFDKTGQPALSVDYSHMQVTFAPSERETRNSVLRSFFGLRPWDGLELCHCERNGVTNRKCEHIGSDFYAMTL